MEQRVIVVEPHRVNEVLGLAGAGGWEVSSIIPVVIDENTHRPTSDREEQRFAIYMVR